METKNVKSREPRTLENDIKILSGRHRHNTFFLTSVDLSALTAMGERQDTWISLRPNKSIGTSEYTFIFFQNEFKPLIHQIICLTRTSNN